MTGDPTRNGMHMGPGAEFDAVRAMLNVWGDLAIGIGGDTAVLSPYPGMRVVTTVDSSVEGVHFRRGWLTPAEIGYRATAASLSDLAAAGAAPIGVLIAITVPDAWRESLTDIARGVGDAVRGAECKILGGDLSRGGELSICVTALGQSVRPLARNGASPGDSVFITGVLGGSAAGLAAMLAGKEQDSAYRDRFVRPIPRLKEGVWLAAHGATAAIDISDGLGVDLRHLAAASGVRIEIDGDLLPVMPGLDVAMALASGEEYELVVSGPASLYIDAFERLFGLSLTRIGEVVAGEPAVVVTHNGESVDLPLGHDHFS